MNKRMEDGKNEREYVRSINKRKERLMARFFLMLNSTTEIEILFFFNYFQFTLVFHKEDELI